MKRKMDYQTFLRQQQQQQQIPQQQFVTATAMQPPMPTVVDMANQIPQAPVPQTTYNTNLMSNSSLSTINGIPVGKRQSINMENVKRQDEVIHELITEELKVDFHRVEEMTLLDDDDILYTLYMKNHGFNNRKYLYSLLCNMYKEKYADLYELYPSLCVWVSFCLGVLICRSEANLRCIARSSANIKIPTVSNNSAFGIMSRKRIRMSSTVVEPEELSEQLSDQPSKRPRINAKHPFCQLPFYIEHGTMFKLGTMIKYCVPSDFSVLFVDAKEAPCAKIVTKNERSTYNGIRGMFKRSVVASLQFRRVQNYPFINIPFMNTVGDLLSKMSGLSIENDPFTMGTKLNMIIENLSDERQKMQYSDKKDDDNDYYMTLITSFQCIGTNVKTMDIRCYSNTVYKLTDDLLDISDLDVLKIEDMNKSREEELLKAIEEYENEQESTSGTSSMANSPEKKQ